MYFQISSQHSKHSVTSQTISVSLSHQARRMPTFKYLSAQRIILLQLSVDHLLTGMLCSKSVCE